MVGTARSSSFACTLAIAALLVARSGPEARAQVFGHAEKDSGSSAALGSAVARTGDLDGDGIEDFMVGGPNQIFGGVPGCGTVVFVSGTGGAFQWINGTTGSNLGAAVDGRIDVDGDGFLDVLFGAPLDSSHAANGGAVYAYSPHLNYDPLVVYGGTAGANLGSSVRSLQADLDGDGFEDFIVGAPGIDSVHVISSGQNAILFTNNGQNGSGFGTSVCRGGDLDNDGICDYLVGSPDYVDSGGTKTGRVTAFSGATGNKLWSVDGAADSRFGRSLTAPGDLDNDGVTDIVVGVPQHLDAGGNKTGCATVLSGASQAVIYKVFGDHANDTFGHDVHGVGGDIDHDGIVDFIVGAPQLLGSDVGYARTISGATGATLFTYLEHSNDPNTKSDYGSAVCGGDFNNDGRPDVAIGGSNFSGGDGIVETWMNAWADWNNYGAGWPGTNGIPAFTPRSDPVVGKTLKIDLDNSAGISTPGFLVMGLAKASIQLHRSGTLLVSPLLFTSISIPAGGLTLSDQISNDPSIYGVDIYLQALEVDAGASKGLSFTRGLDLFLGFD